MWQRIRPLYLTVTTVYCIGSLPIWVDDGVWTALLVMIPVLYIVFWVSEKGEKDGGARNDRNIKLSGKRKDAGLREFDE